MDESRSPAGGCHRPEPLYGSVTLGMVQFNIRVPAELRASLRVAARRRGVSVAPCPPRARARGLGPAGPTGPASKPPAASEEAHAALVELVAERTGLPRAVVRRKLERGGVRVDERDAREVLHVPAEGAQVTVEGRPV